MSQPKKPLSLKERDRQRQTQQAAQKALEAQKKAHELTQAAAGAGDPNLRQKYLEEALEKEVEAETFGKTARYLNTGAFQGLCAGAGLGTGIGVSLGVITGTLVGGTTSVVTGPLGAGLGLGIGAVHGQWFSVGKAMGKGIRKITGDLPGWKSTEEQKAALDKMVNGVREQERPPEDELIQMSEVGGVVVAGQGYTGERKEDEGERGLLQGEVPGKDTMRRVVTGKKKKKKVESKVELEPEPTRTQAKRMERGYGEFAGEAVTTEEGEVAKTSSTARRRSSRIQQSQQTTAVSGGHAALGKQKYSNPDDIPRKKPKKLEIRSGVAKA